MKFTQENKTVQLCVRGLELEGEGELAEANNAFVEAWGIATTDFEKFTAAHYVARYQQSVAEKLKWDETALHHALRIRDESIKGTLPSLYLNIGKCYEDLRNFSKAKENYQSALSFISFLPEDGYGNLIKKGVINALNRITINAAF